MNGKISKILMSLLPTIEIAVLPFIALTVIKEKILEKNSSEKKEKAVNVIFWIVVLLIVAAAFTWSISLWKNE